MSVTVTKTATAANAYERWTNFSPSFLQYMDSYPATCNLRANDSAKLGTATNFGFAIPLDATITEIHVAAYWWGSNAGSYIKLWQSGRVGAVGEGAVQGMWATIDYSSALPTPAEINGAYLLIYTEVGRTTGAAVNVNIDQIVVSVTYEPYSPPPPPPPPPGPTGGAPTVETHAVNSITSTRANLYGNVTSDNGHEITERGICVARWANPTGSTFFSAGTTGIYSGEVAGLAPGTTYHFTAYGVNAMGTTWGADMTFTTLPQNAGAGGAGLVSSLSGQSTGYAGGGGGGMLGSGAGGGATHGGGLGKGGGQAHGSSGVINTGGGGGGAGGTGYGAFMGGEGGKGVVVIRYKTADAIATSPSLSTNIFRPSLAYRGGRLFAPYSKGEDAKILTISGNTVAAATVLSTTFPSANIIPQMTSATAPSGVASASSVYGEGRAEWQAFDHVNPIVTGGSTGWMAAAGTAGWLQYQFPSARIITSYAVTSRNEVSPNVHAPKTWTLKGSNNGSTWVTLDTRTNVTDWASSPDVRKFFDFTNATAYAYYRLDITASNGASYVGVGELELMEAMTTLMHGILAATDQAVVIAGSNSTPSIDGSHIATRIDDTHFSIPVNVTTAGTGGLVLYNHSVGWALTSGGYNDVGWLTQSPTTFHTGSMKKDFRYASVSHDVLPDGATVRPLSWLIDGVYGTANGVAYSPQETRYPIDQQGYSIETTLGMTPDYTKSISPVVRGINVIWNFVKNKKHTYSLDCRSGANAGRWGEDPLAALKFLYATANERASFEDRFAGVYQGAIESVEFTPAPISSSEGPSGICKIVVREQQ